MVASSRLRNNDDSIKSTLEIPGPARYPQEVNLARLLFLVSLAVSIAFGMRAWIFESIYIATASMEPTLPVGGHYFSDKMTLRLRAPKRGDIVLFPSPTGQDIDLGKRVIATPGETVELRQKKVFINGTELEEPYARHKREGERLIGDTLGPLTVPADGVFVLGDNRDESEDSSVWKNSAGEPIYFIKIADLRGVVRGAY